ncbi:MAG: pyruvate ferredoxin oxidoreductase [Armatimonadetes bacterium]|nr:pyruvate ferredoxin oxidoreductase [Armatimonadota bacterium]MDW8027705.1 pyruvate ferredoxin oxidoreductase [Armatimonadota bacterium]
MVEVEKLPPKVNEEQKRLVALSGNEAQAEAMRQINPDVVAAYPITPQTEIVMQFAQFVADGKVDTEYVPVESEHSAMSACIGAAAAGARAMTATSAQGLALMWELLYIASGMRLPIVMAVVARALSANLNIHCDHSDVMGARDSGWIQIFAEDPQEAYDSLIQAVVIAERARLPVMVITDGFIISHAVHPVTVYPDEAVREFIGEYKPEFSLLNVQHPITMGPVDLPDYYMEHKRQQTEAMKRAKEIILQVGEEFANFFGTKVYRLMELESMEDAEVALVSLGSSCGTVREAVRALRSQGIKVGAIKLRVFRPFPRDEIVKVLAGVKVIGVLDRADSFSTMGGPMFTEIKAALYDILVTQKQTAVTSFIPLGGPKVVNYIYGLGGRDLRIEQVEVLFHELLEIAAGKQVEQIWRYIGVRE